MFEHVRASLQNQITSGQSGVQQALAAYETARLEVERQSSQASPLQQALTQAQANLQQANATLNAARGEVGRRQQERDAAQVARDQAAQALADHGEPPDDVLGNGKPNPSYRRWQQEQARLQAILNAAQSQLDSANAALVQAQQARDTAANGANAATAAVNGVNNQITAANAAIGAARLLYAAAQAAVGMAQQVVTQLNAQVGALDARAARLVASPLNRTNLEAAADAELADLLARRARRRDLLVRRANDVADRATTLDMQDAAADAGDTLRREIGGWSDATRFANLATVTSSIDAVVADSRAQRGRALRARTDDLGVATARLNAGLDALQAAVQQANAERDAAATALTQAAQALATHQQAQP